MKGMKLDVYGWLLMFAVFCLAAGIGGVLAFAADRWGFVGRLCDGVFLLLVAGALWLVAWESGRRFERQFHGLSAGAASCSGMTAEREREIFKHEGHEEVKEMGRAG